MTRREATRLITGIAAALAFVAHQVPDGTHAWVTVILGALNAALVAWLGMREPGGKTGDAPHAG